jgi:hypothetical protein
MSAVYEFRVDGHLARSDRDAFCDMEIEDVPAGLIIRGTVIDQAHLQGIISTFQVLGLSIVFVRPVVPDHGST